MSRHEVIHLLVEKRRASSGDAEFRLKHRLPNGEYLYNNGVITGFHDNTCQPIDLGQLTKLYINFLGGLFASGAILKLTIVDDAIIVRANPACSDDELTNIVSEQISHKLGVRNHKIITTS